MIHKIFILILCLINIFFISLVRAEGEPKEACFPISHAAHDNECYDFEDKAQCLDRSDVYSCGWGKSKEKDRVPAADDTRTCDDSRCGEYSDPEE